MKPYYQHDEITIYHGRTEELLPHLSGDLILTDPPYGIGEAAGKNRTRGKAFGGALARKNTRARVVDPRDYGDESWDDSTPPEWIFGLMRSISKWQIIFGGNFFPLPPSSCWLVWDKDNSGDFADCELAWTNFDKAVRRLVWRWNGCLQEDMSRKEMRVYPTQKPVAVMKWALTHAPVDIKTVIDPYMGSGTSLVAAKLARLEAVGIDQREEACEITAKRLSQEVFDFDDQPDSEAIQSA